MGDKTKKDVDSKINLNKKFDEKFDEMKASFENGNLDPDPKHVSFDDWMKPWEGLKKIEGENGSRRYAIKNMFHIQNYTPEELKEYYKKEGIDEKNDSDMKNKLLNAFIAARSKIFVGGDNGEMQLVSAARKTRRKSRRKKRRKTKRRKKRRKSRRKTRRKTKRRKTKNHK